MQSVTRNKVNCYNKDAPNLSALYKSVTVYNIYDLTDNHHNNLLQPFLR
jgi:hypothetical protein